jgi:mannose-6-phosphate isomerase class I
MTNATPVHRIAGRTPNYDRNPFVGAGSVADCHVGWDAVCAAVKATGPRVVVVEAYPGVADRDLHELVARIAPDVAIDAAEAMFPEDHLDRLIEPDLTEDPVFGRLTTLRLEDFFVPSRREELRERVRAAGGTVVVFGTGASLIADGDLLVYADMPRREAQLRQRRDEATNLGSSNPTDDPSLQYKRSFFIDWRVTDAHKITLFDRMDFVLDTCDSERPKMISGATFRRALGDIARRPFRVVPWFDPAPWGGRWLMAICGLDPGSVNYGWAFDCVHEENSLLLGFGDVRFESPAINLVYLYPELLLGARLVDRFGAEFPIRFDILDTMEGGNLSLQVHPLTTYMREHFGLDYTQDESYYVLDAEPNAGVYLGLKEGVDATAMVSELRAAARGEHTFSAEKYVNRLPAARHDHFLIPAGTVHCSGADTVVLEISATPYIFTFKLWDWDRLGLDGRPRPLHLDHGANSIQWDRDERFVLGNLVNRVRRVAEGQGWTEERTGLHELQFIETARHWFTDSTPHDTNGRLNVLNLVSGEEAIVESPSDAFDPFIVHYAETFIVPASVGEYTVRPHGEASGTTCATLKAFVRDPPSPERPSQNGPAPAVGRDTQ